MTGGFSWESIVEYVYSYSPLDSGVDSKCAGFAISDFAGTGFALSALLSGDSTAEYGYLGYLVLLIQKQGMLGLRTSVIFANLQKGVGALFGVFLVYMAKFRLGLARMILYTYATFISGSQLLWVSPSKRSFRRLFLVVQLSVLRAGYAGEASTSYVFKTQLEKAEKKSRNETRRRRPDGVPPTTKCCGPEPGCTCYQPHDGDDPFVWCRAPASCATARESCVCYFFGEQYNWRPYVCPMLKEEAREGLRTCCYPELSCTEEENSGKSSVKDGPFTNGPQDTEEETDSVSIQQQKENARKLRNRVRKKLFAAKLPGTILGTVLAIVFSTENFIKISTAVTLISYNLFFWMGARWYELGEMENDITEEKKSGETEKQDEKEEEKIDGKGGKQIALALGTEAKKAVEVVLKLLPLWLTFASTCYLVNATGDSFFMEQVDYLENNTESFKIPKSVFYAFKDIVSKITGQVCHCLIEQYHNEKKRRWAMLLRISIGMVFSSLCCIVASLVAHRLDDNYNSASMLWLLPQFLLWGMMKGILEEALEEFLHDHLNDDLQVEAVRGVADTVGNLISTILTAVSPSSWVDNSNDISKSHLDYYYRMLAFITLSSTFLFTIVAIAYEFQEKEGTKENGKKS